MGPQKRPRRRDASRSQVTEDVVLPNWVWPYWLERQLDPRSPAFVPREHGSAVTNVTNRSWTSIGTVGSPSKAIVDARGLVTPRGGWSLDWWIGADDRWHVPSREPSVRQSLVRDTPVVETAMRVPGGDAVHRVYAIPGEEPMVVVEITNSTSIPFAVAFAVRPYNLEGLATVETIELHDRTVTVDDRAALLFPKRPRRVAAGTLRDGDSAEPVLRGEAGEDFPPTLRDEAGMAQAAFVFPLAHRATLRVAIPFAAGPDAEPHARGRRPAPRVPAEAPVDLPDSEVLVRGWEAQTANRGMRLVLPEGKLAKAVEANRRYLLLFHEGRDVTPGPLTAHRFGFRDAAYLLGALDRYGFHREADEVLRHFPERQQSDGLFSSEDGAWDANGAALFAMAEHWRLTGDASVVVPESVAAGARWIERKRNPKRPESDPQLRGLLPAGVSADHLGPFGHHYADDLWSLRGLLDAATLLRQAGRDDEAVQVETWAEGLRRDFERSIALVAERSGSSVLPSGPHRHIDPAVIGSLVACSPLALYAADHPMVAATADAVRDRFCIDRAFFQGISHTGLSPHLTLQLAAVELQAGDRRALDRLQWVLDAATPTYTWPEIIHPQLGGGSMGDGHDGRAAAELLTLVRNLLVREARTGQGIELALCSMLPEAWAGHGIEVHEAPTHAGRMSFAVRWHGDRPALLWQLEPHGSGAGGPVGFTAPGLDPRWSSTELRGEALLAPFPDFPGAEPEPPAPAPLIVASPDLPSSGSFS